MKRMSVKIEKYVNNSYEIEIGYNLFGNLIQDLIEMFQESVHKYAIITDSNVEILYGRYLLQLMHESGLDTDLFTIPAGEASKTREMKAFLEDQMLDAGFRRDSCIIAFGGGVVTDLAGFVAATYCRGVPIVNYATTFLAAADASIGGKTAVDVPLATNMIGVIVQPRKVYIDLKTWETLDDEQIANGLSETIKHACIADLSFFELLEQNIETIQNKSKRNTTSLNFLEYVCEKNVQIKYHVVSQDETEKGLRQVLNLGHTVGRAVEAACSYQISHGHAVSIGMTAQALLGLKRGYITEEQKNRIIGLYAKAGLPVKIEKGLSVDRIIEKMHADKKVRKGEIRFVFQKGIGDMMRFHDDYSVSINEKEVREILVDMV